MSGLIKAIFEPGWLSHQIDEARIALIARNYARERPLEVLNAVVRIRELEMQLAMATEAAVKVIENYRPFPDQKTSPMRHFYETHAKPELLAAMRAPIEKLKGEKG